MDVDDLRERGVGDAPTHIYTCVHRTFIFSGAGSLPTWTEDRTPREHAIRCSGHSWKGVETSEVTGHRACRTDDFKGTCGCD